jgi:hypothetical protein
MKMANETVLLTLSIPEPAEFEECQSCGTPFSIQHHGDKFYLKPKCKCDKDGTNNCTLEKLLTKLSRDTANRIFSDIQRRRSSGLPNTTAYWTVRGFTDDQAKSKALEIQKTRNAKAMSIVRGSSEYTPRSAKFWMRKGYSASDAQTKVAEYQTRNGLAWYIDKFGEVEGRTKYNDRIEQWLNSPGNKNMTRGRSVKSITLFDQLSCGWYGKHEKVVRGVEKSHRVDFLYEKKIIEFFGDYWHGNPLKYDQTNVVRKKSVSDIWAHDSAKINDLIGKGYEVMIIWESDYIANPVDVLSKCKDFIHAN